MQEIRHYDIAIIGSGPTGEKAAIQASKLKKRVFLIDKREKLGGASLHTGTIPSKSLRETVVNLELLRRRTHGIEISMRENVSTEELMYRKELVISEQENKLRRNLIKNRVTLERGRCQFLSPTELQIQPAHPDQDPYRVTADYMIVATGSSPRKADWAQLDNECVFDSDTILNIEKLPKKITIIGAGVIGCEYACIFAKLGIRVNLIARDRHVMPFLDREIAEALVYRMRNQRITMRLGENVKQIVKISPQEVRVELESGKTLPCSTVMLAAGRVANSDKLGLEEIGVELGHNGLIQTNEHYQTNIPNIYAVGDVVGFPALASTSLLQARIATLHAFGQLENERIPRELPYGIWTIPAVAYVGRSEEELTDARIPYEVGIAHFKEISRAHIMGEQEGILKLLFCPETLRLLGVHIIGPRAPELIHLGNCVLHFEGTIKFFINSVFNVPTLDEAYRIAAFNGMNRLDYDSL